MLNKKANQISIWPNGHLKKQPGVTCGNITRDVMPLGYTQME